jgi:hypothetical protein
MNALLPPAFAALEPFTAHWAGASAADRAGLRDDADLSTMHAFHAATQPLLDAALAHLDARPLAQHDERERRLMRLMLSFAHVALAVEVQREEEPMHRRLRAPLVIRRAPADLPAGSDASADRQSSIDM